MVCLGLQPGAAGWKAQTNPLSYGGTLLSLTPFTKGAMVVAQLVKWLYPKPEIPRFETSHWQTLSTIHFILKLN